MPLSRRWLRTMRRSRERAGTTTTRNTSWWERNRQNLEVLGVWTEALGVLIAAVAAIQQYKDNSSAEQVNKTLKYLDRFQEERVFKARQTLDEAWTERRDEVYSLLESKLGDAAFAKYLTRTIEKEKLASPISTVMDFYDELEACTSANLCDRDTAVRFFGKYAWDFYGLLHPYIEDQRRELHDAFIGVGIDHFARSYRDVLRRQQSVPNAERDANTAAKP